MRQTNFQVRISSQISSLIDVRSQYSNPKIEQGFHLTFEEKNPITLCGLYGGSRRGIPAV